MTDNEEIHGNIYAWTALIIVPIKALLNPLLFTLLTIVQPQVSDNIGVKQSLLCMYVHRILR